LANTNLVRSHIALMLRVREMVLRTLGADLEPRHLIYQIGGEGSHIAWLAGHMATSCDRLVNVFTFEKPSLDPKLLETYGMGTKPVADLAKYHSLDELKGFMATSLEAAIKNLEGVDDDFLLRPHHNPEIAKRFPAYNDSVRFVPPHDAYHGGQISMLRRVQGLPAQTK